MIPDASVDLIFADPPYNIGKKFADFHDKWPSDARYAEWCSQWLDLCIAKLKKTGSLYVMSSTQCMPYLDLYLRDRLTISLALSGITIVRAYKQEAGTVRCMSRSSFVSRTRISIRSTPIEFWSRPKRERREDSLDYRKAVPTQYNTSKFPAMSGITRGYDIEWPNMRITLPKSPRRCWNESSPQAAIPRLGARSILGYVHNVGSWQEAGRKTTGIEQSLEYVKVGLRRLGIQEELDGERLEPLDKTYVRKNGKPPSSANGQATLFQG